MPSLVTALKAQALGQGSFSMPSSITVLSAAQLKQAQGLGFYTKDNEPKRTAQPLPVIIQSDLEKALEFADDKGNQLIIIG